MNFSSMVKKSDEVLVYENPTPTGDSTNNKLATVLIVPYHRWRGEEENNIRCNHWYGS